MLNLQQDYREQKKANSSNSVFRYCVAVGNQAIYSQKLRSIEFLSA